MNYTCCVAPLTGSTASGSLTFRHGESVPLWLEETFPRLSSLSVEGMAPIPGGDAGSQSYLPTDVSFRTLPNWQTWKSQFTVIHVHVKEHVEALMGSNIS